MLRLGLLVLYLIASYSSGLANISGGWDLDGLNAPSSGDGGSNLDPNG